MSSCSPRASRSFTPSAVSRMSLSVASRAATPGRMRSGTIFRTSAFSVQMPNTYVCLPGFEGDSNELCKEKLTKEESVVKEIAACVSERKSVRQLKRGSFPWTKTYILRPLFNRYLLTDKYFNVDSSGCISCGRCRKSCPVGNIILDEVPKWQSHCAGCLACYHACPYHAINFGSMTQKKGQYNIMKQLYG